ncbi:MAG: ABC transporter ATP-binding protein [Proteobacteria bacterium]|nr:ABC transporter ATP-binding protein [Pseudomonadota bacterium]MDA1059321.1 ABC transporter ATP-binding protein [Pseudomonadota bacterium]
MSPVSRPAQDLFAGLLPPVPRKPLQRLPRGLYTYVWRVSGPQQARLVLMTLAVFPLAMVPLELQRRIVNAVVSLEDFGVVPAVYLIFIVVSGGLKWVRGVYLGRVAEGVIRRLRFRVVRTLDGDDSEEGAKVSMVVAEVEKIGGFVAQAVADPLLQAGVFFSVFGYMLVVEPLVAVVAFGFFVPSLLLTPVLQNVINRLSAQRIGQVRQLSRDMTHDDFNGLDEAALTAHYDPMIEEVHALQVRIVVIKHLLKVANNALGHLGPLSVLVLGGWLVLQGRTEVGTIVAFVSGYERLMGPARDLLNFYRQYSQMRVQYRLVADTVRTDEATQAG